jgi:hypothetical protein
MGTNLVIAVLKNNIRNVVILDSSEHNRKKSSSRKNNDTEIIKIVN